MKERYTVPNMDSFNSQENQNKKYMERSTPPNQGKISLILILLLNFL